MKTISIIVPMYNSFHIMKKNLHILASQQACKVELIIIDDCSTDDSYIQATKYANVNEMEIKVIQNETNRGPGYSRNNGLKHATGEYIAFLDSDDYFSAEFTEILAPILETGVDCVIFDYYNTDEFGNIISNGNTIGINNITGGLIERNLALVYSGGMPWGKIYRREVIIEQGVEFANLYRNEDMPFTKHAIAVMNSVYYCPNRLYYYVQMSTSLMHNDLLLDEMNCQKAYSILYEKLSPLGYQEELIALELREVLNNTVLIKVSKKEPPARIKQYIRDHYSKQHVTNKYIRLYRPYVKVITYCAYYKLLFLLDLALKYKRYKRK